MWKCFQAKTNEPISLVIQNFCAGSYVLCLCVGMQTDVEAFYYCEESAIEAWLSTVQVK
jgi:hypothetical protein